MSEGTFDNPEVVEVETDLLLIGGSMAACGAAFEAKHWASDDTKIILIDKAAINRSDAVAQGLPAINTYIGENTPEDYVRTVHADLMGITRDVLVYDIGRHVDDTVHLFEEWGLPIWKSKETEGVPLKDGSKPVRSGRWQIMVNGESYKPIVAEAEKKAIGIENIYERVFIVKLLLDANEDNRLADAIGFSVRENKIYVFKCNTALLAGGGAIHRRRPGPHMVSGVERGIDLRHGGGSWGGNDHDGKPLRADPVQGRVRPGRGVVPVVQIQGDQRLWRGLHDQERRYAEGLRPL